MWQTGSDSDHSPDNSQVLWNGPSRVKPGKQRYSTLAPYLVELSTRKILLFSTLNG